VQAASGVAITIMNALRSSRTTIALAAVAIAAVLAVGIGLLVFRGNSGPTGDLSEAVKAGDADLVRAHLESGADPDEPRAFGLTPLMRAAIRDDVAIVALLLDAGADLNATAPEGLTAIHVAAQADAAASLEALVATGADMGATSSNGMNALHHAADLGSVGVIELIAAQGMDLDVRSEAVTQGHGHPRDRGASALGIAARAGQLEAVETLLALGAGVDTLSAAGHSPLLLAVFSGYSPEVVAVLLAEGADPRIEASCELGGCLGEPGDALEWARRLNQQEMVPLLEAAMPN
jgi:ankyrin repeat protein